MPEPSRGFVYVATGAACVDEAVQSATSFKGRMYDTPICLFTDLPERARNALCLDEVRRIPAPAFGPSDKFYGLANSPYELTVFVDTDTWCVDQVNELFRILERFELAAAHAPVRAMNLVPSGVPRCSPN